MRRWLLLIAVLLGGWATPAAAQNCVVANGVTTCANTFRFTAPIFVSNATARTDAVYTIGDATHNFKQGYFGGAVNIAATSTDGLVLQNLTSATSAVTAQYSPRLKVCGTAYNSTSLASETDCWIAETQPVTVAGTTTSKMVWSASIAGGAYSEAMKVTNAGTLQVLGSIQTDTIAPLTGGKRLISGAAPTVSSGFGTSPAIPNNNGAASFTVDVGTGGVATSGILNLGATASTGWNCFVIDRTTNIVTRETATTTTTATLTAASAWGANDILQVTCFAF